MTNKSKLVYVRFNVNVAINKALPTMVSLKSKGRKWSHSISYENVVFYFQHCASYGHIITECSKNQGK